MLDDILLPDLPDYTAPDTSEIRLLKGGERGGLAHGTLPPGGISRAIRHRVVEELWFVTDGEGELWRSTGNDGGSRDPTPLRPGVSLSIPPGTHFQFRATGDTPLRFIMATMPPWPGPDEAERVPDHWTVSDTLLNASLPPLDPSLYQHRKCLPTDDDPQEIVYEVSRELTGGAWGIAYADIRESVRHKHLVIRETYLHLDGPPLAVQRGERWSLLEPGDSIDILPHTPHMARSIGDNMSRILVTTHPAWYPEDHIEVG